MFSIGQLNSRLLVQRQNTAHMLGLVSAQQQSFNSFFGGIFGKKKDEAAKEAPAKKVEEKAQEPAMYHREPVQQEEDAEDIKQKIRSLDRTGDSNLFGRYKRQRKTLKERNSNFTEHLHPALAANPRVSIEKYQNRNFKRGLQEGEHPFPIQAKVGPYLVEKPVFGAKNYFYCTCGMSKSQPFCDSSHKGSAFKPIKFSLDERSDQLHLCGCKLSTKAPFCDGQTCKKILAGETFNEAQALFNENAAAAQIGSSEPSK